MDVHLASCGSCRTELTALRDVESSLGEVPPEAFVDGPPPDADLVLQRTLRRVRAERGAGVRRYRTLTAAAAVVAAAALLGGGTLLGRSTAPGPGPQVAVSLPPGTERGAATNQDVQMSVAVIPAKGWVRVNASVSGIPAGQRCRLVVVSRDGTRQQAGSWLVSPAGEKDGSELEGFALVDQKDVVAVEVENFDGRTFVSVPL